MQARVTKGLRAGGRWQRGLFALLCLLWLAPLLAAPPTPLLWKAEGRAGTVYLLGSFHLLRSDDYPLAESVEQAYAKADRLVFELAPELMQSPQLGMAMVRSALLADGKTLNDVLSSSTIARLRRHLGSASAYAAIARFKPWFVNIGLALQAIRDAGMDPELGLDRYLMRRVRAEGKPSSGLEGIDEQVRAFDAAPLSEQETSLLESLRPASELQADIRELHIAWRGGDVDTLRKLQDEEFFAKTPVTGRLVITERNERWLPQIMDMLDQPGTTLVVVGAMHLVGPVGLPELLSERGVVVQRVGL